MVYTQDAERVMEKQKKGKNERKNNIYPRISASVGRTFSLHNGSSNSSHKYTQDPRTLHEVYPPRGFCAVCLGQKDNLLKTDRILAAALPLINSGWRVMRLLVVEVYRDGLLYWRYSVTYNILYIHTTYDYVNIYILYMHNVYTYLPTIRIFEATQLYILLLCSY